jgi:hypothetical protein
MTRPRTNAGCTACPFEASARTISTSKQANTSLISGSTTRSPWRPKNQGATRGRMKISATEMTRNAGNQTFGLRKIAESASAVQRSVDEGGAHQELAGAGVRKAALDEHRVDHRQRRGRERRSGDQRRSGAPVQQEIRRKRGDDERPDETVLATRMTTATTAASCTRLTVTS